MKIAGRAVYMLIAPDQGLSPGKGAGAWGLAVVGDVAELVSLYESGRLERTELAPAFERGYADRWFTTVANGVEAVRGFNSGRHEALQERFRQLDRGFVTTTRREVAAKLSARAPAHAPDASPQSELGLLQREIQKRRAHLPTRRLIESIPNLVARLKPCFLMSPSVMERV